MATVFQQRHFSEMAHEIAGVEDDAMRLAFALFTARVFFSANPRFKRALYMRACRIPTEIQESTPCS